MYSDKVPVNNYKVLAPFLDFFGIKEHKTKEDFIHLHYYQGEIIPNTFVGETAKEIRNAGYLRNGFDDAIPGNAIFLEPGIEGCFGWNEANE